MMAVMETTHKHSGKEIAFVDAELGPITYDEQFYMRQVPIGYRTAEWTKGRLDAVRDILNLEYRQTET